MTRIVYPSFPNFLSVRRVNDNGFKQYFEHDWSKTYAAFRLECDTYPGLTARDGHYTKKEFVDLQKLAEQSYVENLRPQSIIKPRSG